MDKNFKKVAQAVSTVETEHISPLATIKNAVDIATTEGTDRYDDVYTASRPNTIIKHWQDKNAFYFQSANKHSLKVEVLNPHILRFRYAVRGVFERDFSYAIDPNFQAETVEVSLSEAKEIFQIRTPKLYCHISKADLKVSIRNTEGKVICADAEPFHAISTLMHGTAELKISKIAHEDEAYYG
ncbi:MAG: DUF4968 domain-containing protein, partial [Bacteroidota bacterium]